MLANNLSIMHSASVYTMIGDASCLMQPKSFTKHRGDKVMKLLKKPKYVFSKPELWLFQISFFF